MNNIIHNYNKYTFQEYYLLLASFNSSSHPLPTSFTLYQIFFWDYEENVVEASIVNNEG